MPKMSFASSPARAALDRRSGGRPSWTPPPPPPPVLGAGFWFVFAFAGASLRAGGTQDLEYIHSANQRGPC